MLKSLLILLALLFGGSISVLAYNFFGGAVSRSEPPPMKATLMHTKHANETGPAYSKSGHDITRLPIERLEALAEKLTHEEAQVILRKGTERPFCGTLLDNKKEGVYACKLCTLPLFSSSGKFDSGTGWPSFVQPLDKDHVHYEKDESHGMERTEITCARCGGHLGHVFDDGPPPTGRRYCLNSASMMFFEDGEELPPEARPVKTETAYFAGGCFWGVEDSFERLPGVIDAVSGYQGGRIEKPTYEQVCAGGTGHAETVKVVYDPARISYRDLLERFFEFHDPTQVDRQGPDVGTQYRSAIFAADAKQLEEAKKFIADQSAAPEGRFSGRRIATEVVPIDEAGPFWEAEDYHQDYHARRGTSCGLP